MSGLSGFDPQAVEPASDFDPVPPGEYVAVIIDGKIEDISRNDPSKGQCINFTWQVKEGPLENRLFWQRLNLWFAGTEKTPGMVVQIASKMLSSINRATCNKPLTTENGEEMFHIPAVVRIAYQKDQTEYTEVKSVKAIGARSAANPATAAQRPAAVNTGGAKAPPSFMTRAAS